MSDQYKDVLAKADALANACEGLINSIDKDDEQAAFFAAMYAVRDYEAARAQPSPEPAGDLLILEKADRLIKARQIILQFVAQFERPQSAPPIEDIVNQANRFLWGSSTQPLRHCDKHAWTFYAFSYCPKCREEQPSQPHAQPVPEISARELIDWLDKYAETTTSLRTKARYEDDSSTMEHYLEAMQRERQARGGKDL